MHKTKCFSVNDIQVVDSGLGYWQIFLLLQGSCRYEFIEVHNSYGLRDALFQELVSEIVEVAKDHLRKS